MGVEVDVYAPTIETASLDWHHQVLGRDEAWVYRVYDEVWSGTERFDYDMIVKGGYDAVIVEAYRGIPRSKLAEMVRKLRGRSLTVAVIHEGDVEGVEPFLKMGFDLYVVFDERYVNELFGSYRRKVSYVVIPYPCAEPPQVDPWRPAFANGRVLFFSFGRQPVEEYVPYIEALDRLSRSYDLVYWVVRTDGGKLNVDRPWMVEWRRKLSIEEIYSFLKGCDVHLLPKGRTRKVVVSSTLYQIIGSLTPTVVPDTRFFETVPVDSSGVGAVVKFKDVDDLVEKLKLLIEEPSVVERVRREAKRLFEYCRASRVARIFLKVIDDRLQGLAGEKR
jgi:glycosyltransferase involved in cell wall biosynthesis